MRGARSQRAMHPARDFQQAQRMRASQEDDLSSLSQLQADFQQYLLSGEARTVEQHVVGTARVPVATRLRSTAVLTVAA